MEVPASLAQSVSLFSAVTDSQNLLAAWEKVEENAGGPGVDGISVEVFGLLLDEELARLQNELQNRTYRPQPLLRVSIAKPQGGLRTLAIPTVRDRVAQTAAAQIVTPRLETEFEEVSFGYRRGRSVDQALFKVRQYRDEGYQWVVDADLDAFFDNVDWSLLLARLQQSLPDPDFLQLVERWLRAEIRDGAKTVIPTKGIPQGGPISPVLANLYLDRFDEAMMRHGYKFVRFADDFVILCKGKPEAERALQLAESLLGDLRLALKPEKTRLTHFNEGFRYLGTLFVRTLDMPAPRKQEKKPASPLTPPASDSATLARTIDAALQKAGKAKQDFPEGSPEPALAVPPLSPTPPPSNEPEPSIVKAPLEPEAAAETEATESTSPMPRRAYVPFRRTLYIQEQGSFLARDDERLIVKKEGEVLLEVPAAKIDQIFIFGNCTVTTPAMTYCLKEDIPIVLLSSRGNYYGVIDSPLSDNVSLHRLQFSRAADPAFTLPTAKTIVAAKLHNCRLLLQRYQRRKQIPLVATVIERLGELSVRLHHATTGEEVNGYEGAGAAQYFAALGQLVDAEFRFTSRTRQPPTDPVNSLLSFGYTLLFYNLYGLIVARGLHPYVGHLHLMRDRHPALASDLIEEFRAPIVDSLVLTLINNKTLTPADFFRLADGPCLLKDTARKTFIRAFEQKMATQITHPHTGMVVDYRRCLDLQVCQMMDWIRGETQEYTPMKMR
ncbi:MAG: group II intron reverse transcriptase/maturase [Deltaproteobacteria bacterium]|nr:group II intron reverse transcriptase/maturase [Deltaproteobacteria bacterium]